MDKILMEALLGRGEWSRALDLQDDGGQDYGRRYKRSALHKASEGGLAGTVAQLLSLGADAALKDKRGKTPLELASTDEVAAAFAASGFGSSCSEKTINLKVKGTDGSIVHFKIKPTTELKKLMEAYCARQSLQMDQTRFLYGGNLLHYNQTPGELDMQDDNVIEAETEIEAKERGGTGS